MTVPKAYASQLAFPVVANMSGTMRAAVMVGEISAIA